MSETREAKRLRELAEGSRKLEPEDLALFGVGAVAGSLLPAPTDLLYFYVERWLDDHRYEISPAPPWGINALLGRQVIIDDVSYTIASNTATSITVTPIGIQPVAGSYDWMLPLAVGDACSGPAITGVGLVTNANFRTEILYPQFFLPFIHAAGYVPDTPLPI